MRQIDHFIAGHGGSDFSGRTHKVWNPSTGEVQAEVVLGDASVLDAAVARAMEVQPEWAATNPQKRARVMFEFKRLVEAHKQELAELLSSEHGKVVDDAHGDVQRGLEVIEFACGIPQALKGEYTQGAGPGIDVYSMRQPLGIGAGITPFNFPAMIPMWMFGMAVAAGNAFILKPSERDPSVPVRLAQLFVEAGAPEGLLQVVHGDKQMVEAILDHPEIAAISFVGSSDIAQYIYQRGTANAKRVQAFGGAKNHGIVMPDADLDQVVGDLAGAAFGSAGERCMALPVVVPVGEDTAERLKAKLIPAINALRVGVSTDKDAHYGPVVTPEHKARVEQWIDTAEKEGAEVVIDGRGFSLQGHEKGFFVGPTLLDRVTPDMESYKEEIFGPVLQIVRAADFEEAVRLPSEHQYGNGVAIFTRNGHAAREFASRVNVGMVGINVPIPVPVSYHSFGGWKRSGFGDIDQYGMEGLRFWTKAKKVTQRWPDGASDPGGNGSNAFIIPTMG
ncbi:CoA-acylating methylmalonate-semialdehyde dehydrogenase [Altererythrobacter sp. CAU 1778]